MYKLEKNLVRDFIKVMGKTEFSQGKTLFTTEFDYSRGRADVVIFRNKTDVIAIEAKLKKWKFALHQAYRNTCFADYSYVLLPKETALLAMEFEEEFIRRSVGLCYISNGCFYTLISAKKNIPLQNYLYDKAKNTISLGGKYVTMH